MNTINARRSYAHDAFVCALMTESAFPEIAVLLNRPNANHLFAKHYIEQINAL